jgi:rhodanese-related sulfurtransferase
MINNIDTTGLRRLIQKKADFLLVDVLNKEQFAMDHIEGAKNIPAESPDFLTAVDQAASNKTKKVVLYCGGTSCNTSTKAAQRLAADGHTDIAVYNGGIEAWRGQPKDTAQSKQSSPSDPASKRPKTNRSK